MLLNEIMFACMMLSNIVKLCATNYFIFEALFTLL